MATFQTEPQQRIKHSLKWVSSVLQNPSLNCGEHCRGLLANFRLSKPQKSHPQRFQSGLPFPISLLGLRTVMRRPINFDRQPQILAVKIDNEAINRALPIKVISLHLLPLEMLPQNHLTQRHIVPQLPSQLF
jgi:hypothetical protein